MNFRLFQRPHRYYLIALLVVVICYYAWGELTRIRGAQKVTFRPAAQECGLSGSLRYCVYRDTAGTNGDVLYHLHGRNLDEKIWNDDTYFTAMIQSQWQRKSSKPPTVITVSYGSTWLLTPKGSGPESGLLDDFMRRLNDIEAKVGSPRRRMLMGESMGGLNVLIVGLSDPSRFSKVAALCPGVYRVSPFAPLSELRKGLERTGASPKFAFGIWTMARKFIGSEEDWNRVSPLRLIERAGADHPSLYLSNGIYDAYGNFEGTQLLAQEAVKRGVKTEWHPLYGGHCAIDVPSLAEFLVN